MQLVPIIPQPKIGVEETLEVKGVAALRPSKPVAERTLPPLIRYRHIKAVLPPNEIAQREKRQLALQPDRRLICRRIHHQSLLEELRSAIDRRRHKQRNTDLQLHIDEEA